MRVTVPTHLAPPVTEEGEMERPTTNAGWMASGAVKEIEPNVAVIVEETADDTAEVGRLKDTLPVRSGTFTETGGIALGLFEVRVTTKPPTGAALLRVILPVEFLPPITALGVRVKL